MAVARRMEDIRKGVKPQSIEAMLPGDDMNGLDAKQIRVLAWLALIVTEVVEAADDVLSNRWTTTLSEEGKLEGFPTEISDIFIRGGDTTHCLGIDLGAEIHAKLVYNRTRPFKHGGKGA